MKAPANKKPDIDKATLLLYKGKSFEYIRKKLRTNPKRVERSAINHGIVDKFYPACVQKLFMPKYGVSLEDVKEYVGEHPREVAEKLGVSYGAFMGAVRRNGMLKQFPTKVSSCQMNGLTTKYVQCHREGCKQKVPVQVLPGEKPPRYKFCCDHIGNALGERGCRVPALDTKKLDPEVRRIDPKSKEGRLIAASLTPPPLEKEEAPVYYHRSGKF